MTDIELIESNINWGALHYMPEVYKQVEKAWQTIKAELATANNKQSTPCDNCQRCFTVCRLGYQVEAQPCKAQVPRTA